MNTIVCKGLDGANPLHFLAALGAFRLVELADPETRMDWLDAAPCTPRFHTNLTPSGCHRSIWSTLGVRGCAALRTRQHRIRKGNAKADRKRIKRIEAAIAAHMPLVVDRHHAFAAKTDCIHAFKRSDLRALAQENRSQLWTALLPGLAADRDREYKKGEAGLSRTRFSFSNGGSGKALLKDWRASLALLRRAEPFEDGLLGFSLDEEETTGLMWDPSEQRDYSRRWADPALEATFSVPILNVLGLVGLSFLPLVPALPADLTTAFVDRERRLVWPLWSTPQTVDGAMALIGAQFVVADDDPHVRARGVHARFCCKVLSANKRNFFALARPFEGRLDMDRQPIDSADEEAVEDEH